MSIASVWDNSKGVENRELLDGDYTVKIVSVKLEKTKKTELPMMVWQTEILSGPTQGTLYINNVLDESKPFTVDRAKQNFMSLGLNPKSSEMEATMASLAGKVIAVKLNTYNNFQNRDVMGFAEQPATGPAPAGNPLPEGKTPF